jgi:UrcA family protein
MKRTFLCAALAASALAGATTAARAEDGEMRVNLARLDLAQPGDASAALGRIRATAARFCEVADGRTTFDRVMLSTQCEKALTRKAVEQLNAPQVTALYTGRPVIQVADTTLAAR